MIDIIMLADCASKENLRMTDRAIKSYLSQDCKVYLVESSGVKLKVKSKRVKVIQPKQKFNYNLFLQIGLSAIETPSPFVLVSNNDVIAHDKCLTEMMKTLAKYDSCSPVDPWNPHHYNFRRDTQGWTVTVHVCGWCLCFRRSVLDKISPNELFPEELRFWFQDNFYGEALKHNGYKHAVSASAFLSHLDGKSHSLIPSKEQHAFKMGARPGYIKMLEARGWMKKRP